MTQNMKIIISVAAFVLLLAGAMFAYNALRDNVSPEIMLAEQPGKLSNLQDEPTVPDKEEKQKENGAEKEEGKEREKENKEENKEEKKEEKEEGKEKEEEKKIKATDFTMEDLGGNSVKLSDMEGKPLILNFWASWCPPCKAEMPDFDSVYKELGSDVTFMMVNLTDGQRETKEKGAAYVAEQGFSFPVYYDIKQEGAYAYGIRSIPTTLFIDSKGYIVTGAEGQIDEEILRYGISLIQ